MSIARTTQPGHGHTLAAKDSMTPTLVTSHQVGRVYVINIKQADNSRTVVTAMLTFNSTPLVVLFDSGATHSFISSKALSEIRVESHQCVADLHVNLTIEKKGKM